MDLQRYGIWNWKLVNDEIHVNQSIDLSGRELESLPFKVHVVNGDFDVKGNRIKNLENFPDVIKGNFNVSYNQLESLEGFPKVGGLIFLENNNLRSFKGIPEIIQEGLDISNNPLENMGHAPFIENYIYFLHHKTFLDEIHVKIYQACIEKKCWDPRKTMQDNLENLKDPDLEKLFVRTIRKKYGL